MVHHPDEAGRPFVSDVDLPVFAVAPSEAKPFALSSLGEWMFVPAQTIVQQFLETFREYPQRQAANNAFKRRDLAMITLGRPNWH
jgi:hypothetical protein